MSTPLHSLTADLLAVVRRHEPAWTGSNDSDPGVTLLEIGGWIGDRLDSSGGIGVHQVVSGIAARPDPYRDFKFRVTWDGGVVAGVARISALRRTRISSSIGTAARRISSTACPAGRSASRSPSSGPSARTDATRAPGACPQAGGEGEPTSGGFRPEVK